MRPRCKRGREDEAIETQVKMGEHIIVNSQ